MVLFALFQSPGTTQDVPETMKIWVMAPPLAGAHRSLQSVQTVCFCERQGFPSGRAAHDLESLRERVAVDAEPGGERLVRPDVLGQVGGVHHDPADRQGRLVVDDADEVL